MYRLIMLILVFTTLFGSSSCNVPDTNVSSLENEIRSLKSTITNLDNRIAILEAKISPATRINSKSKKKQPGPNQSASSAFASPAVVEPKPSTSHSGTTETYSGRCRATTKKGYQCSRNARSNGYCWQHGG